MDSFASEPSEDIVPVTVIVSAKTIIIPPAPVFEITFPPEVPNKIIDKSAEP